MFNRIIILSFLLILFSSFDNSKNENKKKIIGKWYVSSSNSFSKTNRMGSLASCYYFKNKSKVIFSTCTDRCGCMRTQILGNYKWIDDSTISIKFKKEKGERKRFFKKLDDVEIEKFKIIKLDSTNLKVKFY